MFKIFNKKSKKDDDRKEKKEKTDKKKEDNIQVAVDGGEKEAEAEIGGENEPLKKDEDKDNIVEMKKGDYNVHILIEEVKNLIQIEDGKPPVPRVKMIVFGKDQRTTKMKKPCENFVFNEHYYFDKTNLTVEMLDSEKITLEVYDNNNTKRSDYFGIYEFDFGYVYNQPEHTIRNMWVGLSNPESEDMSKIRGYLKLSVSVLHDNDPRVELEPKDNELSNCVIPIQVKMKYKQISFYFFKGENFPDMDAVFSERNTGRRCDGYIEIKYMGVMRKTKIVEMKDEKVVWNQIIDIPATFPAVSQKICMVVKDDDVGGFDIVGSYEFKIDDIFSGLYKEPRYIDIYGSPINKRGGIYDQMNYNAEIGSRWKGKILMKCEVNDVDSPIAAVKDIKDQDLLDSVYKIGGKFQWKIMINVISASFLPEKEKEYSIKFSIQDCPDQTTQKRKAVNGCVNISEYLTIQMNSLRNEIISLPDLFIYLVDVKRSKENQNVCFQRIKVGDFHLNNDIVYIKLLPDPVINKVSSMMKSGVLKCKIGLFLLNVDKIPDESEFKKGGKVYYLPAPATSQEIDEEDLEMIQDKHQNDKIDTPSSVLPYTVLAVVYMSKGLVAADSTGTSDPFVRLTLGTQSKDTKVKNNTMNGVWNEFLEFTDVNMDIKDISTWPVFLLNVYDWNKTKSDVPMGYNYIWLSSSAFSINSKENLLPRWHSLFLPQSNKKQGQILMSFYVFDKSFPKGEKEKWEDIIKFKPKTIPYNFEINVLGLRELKPLGLIGIKKPFIKFDLNSLNVTGDTEDDHPPIQTVPVSGGSNPTINTVIQFQSKLPVDENFMPELQCEVYDNVLKGLSSSLLGVFSINLKKIIRRTREQVQEDLIESKIKLNISQGNKIMNEVAQENIGININNINTNSIISNCFPPRNIGMSEKSLENSNNNIINTNSNDNELLEISRGVNKKKNSDSDEEDDEEQNLEADENAYDDKNKGKENIDMNIINNMQISVPMTNGDSGPSLNNMLTLDGSIIKQNLNNPIYFVTYPIIKQFSIPGYGQSQSENDPGKGKEKVQKTFFMEDQSKIPDPMIYFKIGYLNKYDENKKLDAVTKHYRRIYRCPLENVDVPQFKIKTPFNVGKIKRGKFIDKKSETDIFDSMRDVKCKIIYRLNSQNVGVANEDNKDNESVGSNISQTGFMGDKDVIEKSYGKFKGLIRITEKSLSDEYDCQIERLKASNKENNEDKKLKNYNKYQEFREKLINKQEVVIRLYVLELNELAKKDLLSESDPYIKIYINDKLIYNERKNHQDDQKNCKWYKYYDIPGEMPGSSNLKIEVLDFDDVLADDLIGSTTIDLEDRYFNSDWQAMKHKPVEVRPLLHPDLNGAQGQVYMWLEIFEASKKSQMPPWSIMPEPVTEFQVRFIVWETEDMEMMDVEGTSDIYVIGYIDQKESQKTDIHFRCQTGAASFNWRMLLPLKIPIQKPELTMQVYDKDIFASDDFMCGATLNLKELLKIPKYLNMPVKFSRSYYNGLSEEEKELYGDIEFMSKGDDEEGIKFWIQCYKGKKEATGEGEKSGRVLCSLEILPKELADLDKVGKGRDEPNVNPHLPPPVGRFEFSLNPFKMVNQCVGPKFRNKCYCYCLCALVLIYFIYALPSIVSGLLF